MVLAGHVGFPPVGCGDLQDTRWPAFCQFYRNNFTLLQGIYNSLKNTPHAPRRPLDAITLAIKEGITRDKNIGQGNGLWGLHNIVQTNSGSLTISSGGAAFVLQNDKVKTFDRIQYLSKKNGATTVDFQIDFDKGISISDALGGHEPLNLRTYSLENDRGNLVYKIAEEAAGTGTRQSGERVRNDLINLHTQSNAVIEIDFSGVAVISSSFADELIGKLVTTYGFFGFNQIFRLTHMNPIVQSILDRSVSQRMAQAFVSTSHDDDQI